MPLTARQRSNLRDRIRRDRRALDMTGITVSVVTALDRNLSDSLADDCYDLARYRLERLASVRTGAGFNTDRLTRDAEAKCDADADAVGVDRDEVTPPARRRS